MSSSKARTKTKKKRKVIPTPEQLQKKAERDHRNGVESFLKKIGFKKIPTSNREINFEGRTGEIDAIFCHENVIVVAEYTVGKSDNAHLLKKKILFDLILDNQSKFVRFCKMTYEGFESSIGNFYSDSQYKVNILYASKYEVSDEHKSACDRYRFIHGVREKYFKALAKTIEMSARIEFLKFLGIRHEDYGENAIGSQNNYSQYDGLLLPEENSNYPQGYRIVSFYADAEGLMEKGYVLRRDSWREDSQHLYQRILIGKKIRNMRKYLKEERRVFVNNIIVTLPAETELKDPDDITKSLNENNVNKPQRVAIRIPSRFDMIGIIDGQHRIFCYHEGTDSAESAISIRRKKQNLLVTGIIYPKGIKVGERRRFEANLFLEINDNQAKAKSSLKQDIEILIHPYSAIAISKRIVQGLGKKGPLKYLLQTGHFDGPELIKTTSIVSYGLRPLVKLDGDDSLFTVWNKEGKDKLKNASDDDHEELLNSYIEHCVSHINNLLLAIKLSLNDPSQWQKKTKKNNGMLSPTTLNGFIVLLREIIRLKKSIPSTEKHRSRLVGLGKFQFARYKSSRWKSLGEELFKQYYSD
ncbi:MAG TPA: DGQHR domain-containing protein [Steroidobacteraceae bacterium]|nr:DGQHR domain-containing protein [Steroidobacteraceae bacterium]